MVNILRVQLITLVDLHNMVLQCLLKVLSSHQQLLVLLLYACIMYMYMSMLVRAFVLIIACFMLNCL